MLTPSPSKAVCLKLAREKLIAIDNQKWLSQLLGDGNGIDNGNKLRTYRKYKNSLSMLLGIWDVTTAVFLPNSEAVIYPLQWKLVGIPNQKLLSLNAFASSVIVQS